MLTASGFRSQDLANFICNIDIPCRCYSTITWKIRYIIISIAQGNPFIILKLIPNTHRSI